MTQVTINDFLPLDEHIEIPEPEKEMPTQEERPFHINVTINGYMVVMATSREDALKAAAEDPEIMDVITAEWEFS